jgi:hypothetical protein
MNIKMQHGSVDLNHIKDMQHGHGHAAWTWTCGMNMDRYIHHGYGDAAGTRNLVSFLFREMVQAKFRIHFRLAKPTILKKMLHVVLFRETIRNESSHVFYFMKHAKFREINCATNKILWEKMETLIKYPGDRAGHVSRYRILQKSCVAGSNADQLFA